MERAEIDAAMGRVQADEQLTVRPPGTATSAPHVGSISTSPAIQRSHSSGQPTLRAAVDPAELDAVMAMIMTSSGGASTVR